jgi:hypothetical protein
MSRFETEILSRDANVQALADLNGKWIKEANRHSRVTDLILDMDSQKRRGRMASRESYGKLGLVFPISTYG